MATQNEFYANAVLVDSFDYTVVDDPEPLVVGRVEFAGRVFGGMVAAAAVVTALTLTPTVVDAVNVGFVQTAAMRTPPGARYPGVTSEMKRRAAVARGLFRKVPFAGADDPEPDYGFNN